MNANAQNTFLKSDLQTGMIVTCRNGEEYIVFLKASIFNDTDNYLIHKDGFNYISDYTTDLFMEHTRKRDFKNDPYDIMKVEQPNCPSSVLNHDTSDRTLLWKRKEPEVITLNTKEVFDILREKYGNDVTITIESAYTTSTDMPVPISSNEYYIKETLK